MVWNPTDDEFPTKHGFWLRVNGVISIKIGFFRHQIIFFISEPWAPKIRDAFEYVGQETTVNKLRSKLASNVDENVFKIYKEQYDMYNQAIQNTTTESIKLKTAYDKFKSQLLETIDREQQRRITYEAKKIKHAYDKLKKENEFSKELLSEFKIMKNIES